jgi:predicted RNase H-like nuclease (RuvC/YqgF family)
MEEVKIASTAAETNNGVINETKKHIPNHHSALWSIISRNGNRGRTYCVAKCCATIYEIRREKKENDTTEVYKSDELHPKDQVIPLTEFLGKRKAWKEDNFSEKLVLLEKKLAEDFEASYNTEHSACQIRIELKTLKQNIRRLEKELKEYREESEAQNRSVRTMIEDLASENKELKKSIDTEIKHREVTVCNLRNVVFASDEFCEACKGKFSKARSCDAREEIPK